MEKHDFVTIADLTREKILYMIEMAQEFEPEPASVSRLPPTA